MKIQNHSVINKWGDPYYVYILPIFPKSKSRLGEVGVWLVTLSSPCLVCMVTALFERVVV